MAESSEAGNNHHDQEMEAGMERPTAGQPRAGPEEAGEQEDEEEDEEVLLLGDVPDGAAAPAHVARLLAWIREQDAEAVTEAEAAMDVLAGLVYVLAVETGFTPLRSGDAFAPQPRGDLSAVNLRCISRMPAGWRTRRGDGEGGPRYVVDLALSEAEPACARLVGVPCAGALIVNMVASEAGPGQAFSVVLSPADFVAEGRRPRNLRALSLRVKEAVTGRARAAVLNSRGVANASLAGLPAEMLLLLAGMLPLADVYHLGATCRRLWPLLDDPALWRLRVRHRYPGLFADLEAGVAAPEDVPAAEVRQESAAGAAADGDEDGPRRRQDVAVDWKGECRRRAAAEEKKRRETARWRRHLPYRRSVVDFVPFVVSLL